MSIWKSNPLTSLVNGFLVDSPTPSNMSYLWNFGSLLGFCLVMQMMTGVTLAMHYNPSSLEAFNSVEHMMRDVNNGWLMRYLHSNTASAFFFLVYLHMGSGLYYGSYTAPSTLVWTMGTVMLMLMMATAFLGYVLPYGQMSLWGATVMTNLMSAMPWLGKDIVEFLWGGFSVNNATLNSFFALHFVLPFVLAALVMMHLIALHDSAGSGNPLGISANSDSLPFTPYFVFKDLITIFLFIMMLSVFVFFMPNVLGDSENYVTANPMQTPPAMVPEWYLLPFYAMLSSMPNKLLGVMAMFAAMLMMLVMPYADLSSSSGAQFKPISKMFFFIFVANFLMLMQLGAKHVESPFIELGQFSTVLYFSHFLVMVPLVTLFENSLMNSGIQKNIGVGFPFLSLSSWGWESKSSVILSVAYCVKKFLLYWWMFFTETAFGKFLVWFLHLVFLQVFFFTGELYAMDHDPPVELFHSGDEFRTTLEGGGHYKGWSLFNPDGSLFSEHVSTKEMQGPYPKYENFDYWYDVNGDVMVNQSHMLWKDNLTTYTSSRTHFHGASNISFFELTTFHSHQKEWSFQMYTDNGVMASLRKVYPYDGV